MLRGSHISSSSRSQRAGRSLHVPRGSAASPAPAPGSRIRRLASAGAAAGVAAAFGGFGSNAAVAALPAGQAFAYTGAEQTYVVPAGVASVAVTAVGAGGGLGCGDISTTPSE